MDGTTAAKGRTAFTSVAPGRLCLFGEHQDYLGFPVIALSLPLACRIRVEPATAATVDKNREGGSGSNGRRRILTLRVPFQGSEFVYDLDDLPPRQDGGCADATSPDFALAALHEVMDDGWTFPPGGATFTSHSEMPTQAGCSSSSAFCVAFIHALAVLAGKSIIPIELARLAHRAEVLHFNGPGGTMDHVTSAVGGLLRIGPSWWQFEKLPVIDQRQLGLWVLAYSGEPKETIRHLRRCKTARLELLDGKLKGFWDNDVSAEELTETEKILLEATRMNRDTESEAAELWKGAAESQNDDDRDKSEVLLGHRLGALMMRHHEALRDGLGLSTPSLEAMNKAAMKAGAWGFKVVGSGGGGCAVAWTPENKAGDVELAILKAGAPSTWIIREPGAGAYIQYINEEQP